MSLQMMIMCFGILYILHCFFTAEEIATKMPPRLLLKWNNVPIATQCQTRSSPHVLLHGRIQNDKVEYSSPETVVVSGNSPHGYYSWPYALLNSQQRTAKCVAHRKIQEIQDLDHRACPKSDTFTKVGKVRKKKVRGRSLANSPVTGKKEQLHVKSGTDLRLVERKGRKTYSSRHCLVALKELSIPLDKVPFHVKKRNLENSDQSASSSSRCFTAVDGVAEVEPSSRPSSSTPLSDNSSDCIID